MVIDGRTIGQVEDPYQKELVADQPTQIAKTNLLAGEILVPKGVKLWNLPANSQNLVPFRSDKAITVGTTQDWWHCDRSVVGELSGMLFNDSSKRALPLIA